MSIYIYLLLLFWLTLEVDHLNPTKSFGVDNLVPIHQARLKNFVFIIYHILTTPKKYACPTNGIWLLQHAKVAPPQQIIN